MITFDKIREIERAERDKKKLQALPASFLDEVKEYIRRKEKGTSSMDSIEIKNIRSTLNRIFDTREKKLLDAALFHIKTGMSVENLTDREKFVLNQVVSLIKKMREDLCIDMSKAEMPGKETKYIVKKDLPEIVGPDMKTYSLKTGQVLGEAELPKPLNELLLREKVIERE